jgi:hypothetical protein
MYARREYDGFVLRRGAGGEEWHRDATDGAGEPPVLVGIVVLHAHPLYDAPVVISDAAHIAMRVRRNPLPAWWTMNPSSKVNLPHAIKFGAVCGANLVTSRSKFRTNETHVANRVVAEPLLAGSSLDSPHSRLDKCVF